MVNDGFHHPTPFEIETALAFGISGKNSVISSYWRPVWAAGRMLQI